MTNQSDTIIQGGVSELTPPTAQPHQRSADAPSAARPAAGRQKAPGTAPAPLRKSRLLIVSESRGFSDLLSPLMHGYGIGDYDVELCTDTFAAARWLGTRSFDVYLFDESSFDLLAHLPQAHRLEIERSSVVITALESPGRTALTSAITIPAARLTRFSLDHALWQICRQRDNVAIAKADPAIYDVLLRLARTDLAGGGDLQRALQPLTEMAAETLGVGRVSIWALREEPKRLVCLEMFDARTRMHCEGVVVPAAQCPVYCLSLLNHRIMSIEDALHDPRSAELGDICLREAGIGALLDSPIYLDGGVAGVLCCAHVGGKRRWSEDEQRLAASFADYAQIVLIAHKRRVAEETLAAKERELAQAQKMEALGRLAGGIAHDFNNLLTVISGRSQVLQRLLPAEVSVERQLAPIMTACDRAQSMVQQLLTFARKNPRSYGWVDIHGVIEEVCDMLSHTIDRRILVSRELSASRPLVHGDRDELHRALLNLGINARDAMPAGGSLVYRTRNPDLDRQTCERRRLDPTDSFLEIAVEDTGTGMSPDIQAHVCEPFFTTKAPGKGTGLGLANVYGCIESHRGHCEFTSVEGQGTCFRLYLPLSEAHEPSSPMARAADQPQQGSGTLLLIDDDDEVRETVATMLSFFGYTVHQCGNPFDGVRFFAEHRDEIDLVLLDMIMPDMDGRDCFRALKLVKADFRCLLLSGFSTEGAIQDCLADGALGIVTKPLRMAEIAQTIASIMKDSRSRTLLRFQRRPAQRAG